MGLTGTLRSGIKIEQIALCQFEGEWTGRDCSACDGEPKYRVRFKNGDVWNACEEHAQQLWDAEEPLPIFAGPPVWEKT